MPTYRVFVGEGTTSKRFTPYADVSDVPSARAAIRAVVENKKSHQVHVELRYRKFVAISDKKKSLWPGVDGWISPQFPRVVGGSFWKNRTAYLKSRRSK